ncbi:dihydrodipicolinate synthase family protein [Micromonospora sp. 4G57]|uniref:Dihydrodipicolinate synthase family protein n=1 Tax=Micromonospora sicca TaxID=2202420 RepID=A0ABU5JBG1_9ACTN|nr:MULTISPECIES: dihydrodipicolinate synthase family protein [unclassified Micromonospora]MDZ5441514.1 dihydrodipicolinate synthase family protein [Micromonospora sp. 4G57]MDZ5489911.1 dihydrodipicolinate synthase family protein [Micromonospora sp. 4G53]
MPHTVHGLVPILATPFGPDGVLDLPSLRRLTEFQLSSGVTGVAVFGMASEGFALTTDERTRILATVTDVVAGTVPVVAGVNGTSTVTAIEQADAAVAGGATALMVLPPFMVKPTPDQLLAFYGEVSAAAGVDVMVQDAPGATGVAMPPALIAELGKLDGVTSVKVESPPTAPKVAAVVAARADDAFAVLGGQNAQFCLEEYARGAIGTMPACEFPDLLAPVLADWEAGRHAEARAAFTRLLPLILFGLQQGIAWAVHKEVLVRRGLIADATVRSPARPLDTAGRESLNTILTDLGLAG